MTYASRLNAKLNPKHPSNTSFPDVKLTAWVLERMAEQEYQTKITGGFNPKLKCPTCNVCLPVATRYCDSCGFDA